MWPLKYHAHGQRHLVAALLHLSRGQVFLLQMSLNRARSPRGVVVAIVMSRTLRPLYRAMLALFVRLDGSELHRCGVRQRERENLCVSECLLSCVINYFISLAGVPKYGVTVVMQLAGDLRAPSIRTRVRRLCQRPSCP